MCLLCDDLKQSAKMLCGRIAVILPEGVAESKGVCDILKRAIVSRMPIMVLPEQNIEDVLRGISAAEAAKGEQPPPLFKTEG